MTKPHFGVCQQCGKEFLYKWYEGGKKGGRFNRKQKFCTKSCADVFQTKGWGTDQHGYKVRFRSDGKGRRVWAMQHREVMESHLGRKLASHETIHHKDGNRANNDLSNLELWSSRHGRGQRVEDKVEFCLSFLREYPEFLADLGYKIEKPETQERAAGLLDCSAWMLH